MLNNSISTSQTLTYIYLNLVIYCIPLIFFYLHLGDNLTGLHTLPKNNKKLFILKVASVLFISNLAGLPMLPGFFVKLNLFILLLSSTNLVISSLFVVLNFIIFFFYIKAYRKLAYTKCKLSRVGTLNKNKLVLFIVLYIVAFPLIYPYLAIAVQTVFI